MFLKAISTQNYRNLQGASLALTPGFWEILGDNGHGKSNLLEAISVLCMGRSRRAERDRDLIRAGENWMRVEGTFIREERGEVDLSVRITPDGKELYTFGTRVPTLGKFVAQATCVMFTSTDTEIVLGDPSERRRFMDDAIAQMSQGYAYDLARYRRALEQKNHALKGVRQGTLSADSLGVWDQQLASHGARVCARRARFMRQIAELASGLYSALAADAEVLSLRYDPSVTAPESLEDWPQAIAEAISGCRTEEIARGISLAGPQRDDISVAIGSLDARSFASRGQARTAVLALRLAQARLARALTGEWPVMLLDDVFPELDAGRRRLLAQLAGEAEQVLATSAAAADLPSEGFSAAGTIFARAGVFSVEAGAHVPG